MSAVIIAPQGYPHAQAFAEVQQSFNACLAELGVDPTIVFGAHLGVPIPRDAIVMNTEVAGSPWMTPEYMEVLHEHRVWDYSIENIGWLDQQTIRAEHCPIGYHKCLEKMAAVHERYGCLHPGDSGSGCVVPQDIDVLFYGSVTPRRAPILKAIRETGLRCEWLFGFYGELRDAYIARSKVVLNLHAYDNSPFEIIRCSYLFANKVCVVTEGSIAEADNPVAHHLLPTTAYLAAEDVQFVVHSPKLREAATRASYNLFRQRPQIEYLRRLLCN